MENRKRFPVLVTENQHDALVELGEENGMSRSEWVRYSSMHYQPKKKHLKYKPMDVKGRMIWIYLSPAEKKYLIKLSKSYDVSVAHLMRTAACFHEVVR